MSLRAGPSRKEILGIRIDILFQSIEGLSNKGTEENIRNRDGKEGKIVEISMQFISGFHLKKRKRGGRERYLIQLNRDRIVRGREKGDKAVGGGGGGILNLGRGRKTERSSY